MQPLTNNLVRFASAILGMFPFVKLERLTFVDPVTFPFVKLERLTFVVLVTLPFVYLVALPFVEICS